MAAMFKTRETLLRAFVAVALLWVGWAGLAQADGARSYPEADKLFHSDPRWLGGDAAISVPLSPERTLWLFGDSFVDVTKPYARAGAAFVHNTIAIQTGNDPRTATVQYYWRQSPRGAPAPAFSDHGSHWYWPSGGLRVDAGPVIVFINDIVATPERGLGFATAGYAVAVIDNADQAPAWWDPRIVKGPAVQFDAVPGAAVVREGNYVVALALKQHGTHAGAFVRYRLDAVAKGDLSRAQWWMGEKKGWVATTRVGKRGPLFVIDDAGAECSMHWDQDMQRYVHVASYGFGSTTIGVRTAAKLTGPWSAPQMVYRPPESDAPRPFVYAGKAHPELKGPAESLLITYVANSFDPKMLLTPEGERTLYWPHFVAVPAQKSQR